MSPSTDQRENREFASEIKFVIPRTVAEQIHAWSRIRLAPDPNSARIMNGGDGYQITSLYFDTDQFDVFHRKGSFGRSKYRIHQYGSSDIVFLERKLKTGGLVSKRRSSVRIEELDCLADPLPTRQWNGRWFYRRLQARRLRPICQISYQRSARVCMTSHGPIRLTLDNDIRALPAGGLTFNADPDGLLLLEDKLILELKYRCELPLLFKQLIEEFALSTQSVSKYRMAVAGMGAVKEVNGAPDNRLSENRPCLIF
jgi:hypothetical protein